MSQSPAVKVTLVIVFAVLVASATADPDATWAEIYSPTLPVAALSFVEVPGIWPMGKPPVGPVTPTLPVGPVPPVKP